MAKRLDTREKRVRETLQLLRDGEGPRPEMRHHSMRCPAINSAFLASLTLDMGTKK